MNIKYGAVLDSDDNHALLSAAALKVISTDRGKVLNFGRCFASPGGADSSQLRGDLDEQEQFDVALMMTLATDQGALSMLQLELAQVVLQTLQQVDLSCVLSKPRVERVFVMAKPSNLA